MGERYGREKPASSLRELTNFLRSEERPGHVYRGQTKDYGTMLPSLARRTTLVKREGFCLFPADHHSGRIEQLQATMSYVIMKKFGNVVGNYLAQQYIALSGCIDITSRIDIAAFFATMRYPDYDSPLSRQPTPGVIYRFDSALFENRVRPSGAKEFPFDPAAKEGEYEVYKDLRTVSNSRTHEFTFANPAPEIVDKLYVIEANMTTFEDVRLFLDEIDANHRNHYEGLPDGFSLFNRPRAQQGGMLQPAILCRYSGSGEQDYLAFNDAIGMEDIYGRYGMETFYFDHGDQALKFSREDLWPSVRNDGTFANLCLQISLLLKMVERKVEGADKINFPSDMEIKDIVDIGYKGNGVLTFDDLK